MEEGSTQRQTGKEKRKRHTRTRMQGASSEGRKRKWSKAWEYFTVITNKDGKEMAKCSICEDNGEDYELVAGSHGTKNLWDHLQGAHGKEMPESERRPRRRKQPLPRALSDPEPPDESPRREILEEDGIALEAERQRKQPLPRALSDPNESPRREILEEDGIALEAEQQRKQPLPRALSDPNEARCFLDDLWGASPRRLREQRSARARCPKKVKVEPDEDDWVRRQEQIKVERKTGLEEVANGYLARLIASHGYKVVEDEHFRSFVSCLDPDFKLPSREDMERMCDDILDKERKKLLSNLFTSYRQAGNGMPGRVSFLLGTVATINEAGGEDTLYTACSFIDGEWNLHRVVTGAYMVVSELNLVVPDISSLGFLSNMLMMVGYEGDASHSSLKGQIYSTLPERAFPLSQELFWSTAYMDCVLHSVARCLLPCKMGIQMNLLDLSTYPGQQEDPRAYSERWYSLYCFLKILPNDHSTTTTTEDYTELIGLLCKLWRSIDDSIQMISDSTRPTSNLCLEELLKLRVKFRDELRSSPTKIYTGDTGVYDDGKTVKDVLGQALQLIEKTIDESYLVWSIPCILDPRCKLKGIEAMFREAFDKAAAAKYIKRVRKKIKELFTFYKVNMEDSSLEDYLKHVKVNDDDDDDKPEDFNILDWWKKKELIGRLETLGRMARDFLAIPTCSKLSSKQTAHVRSIIYGKKSSMVQAFEEHQEEEAETEAAVVGRTSGSSSSMKKKKKRQQ